jgi:hypothetical protein
MGGYIYLLCPEHPRANFDGYVPEQYLIVEKVIGKLLPLTSIVHHVNGKRDDNRPSNFVVCENKGYHSLLHEREKALKACGHASWRKCKYCHNYDRPEKLFIRKSAYHRSCYNEHRRQLRQQKRKSIPGSNPYPPWGPDSLTTGCTSQGCGACRGSRAVRPFVHCRS